MSNESFLEKREQGFFDQLDNRGVCFAAALDRISPRHEVSYESYEAYSLIRAWFVENYGDDTVFADSALVRRAKEIKGRIFSDVGLYSSRQLRYLRVTDPHTLSDNLEHAFVSGFRVIATLDVGAPHAVGVIEEEPGWYWTASNWSPVSDVDYRCWSEPVDAGELFLHLEQPARLRKRRNSARKTKIYQT